MKVTSVYRKDKIGALSEAGGTITLAPSILTIGGKQYDTESSLNVALPSLAANSRYQIFAVVSGGNVQLVISQNENSQGPAGYVAWKLVGCFYSNGLVSVGFGSFVNISGNPETISPIPYLPNWTASSVNPSIGNGNIYGFWTRSGRLYSGKAQVRYGSTTTTGTGVHELSIPFSIASITGGVNSGQSMGFGAFYNDQNTANHRVGVIQPGNFINTFQLYINATGQFGSWTAGLGGVGDQLNMRFEDIFVAEFSSTPIEDL